MSGTCFAVFSVWKTTAEEKEQHLRRKETFLSVTNTEIRHALVNCSANPLLFRGVLLGFIHQGNVADLPQSNQARRRRDANASQSVLSFWEKGSFGMKDCRNMIANLYTMRIHLLSLLCEMMGYI